MVEAGRTWPSDVFIVWATPIFIAGVYALIGPVLPLTNYGHGFTVVHPACVSSPTRGEVGHDTLGLA
jgi:hypothetical protein